MKSMEKLVAMYQKELELAEKHKKSADELKKKELELADKHKKNAADIQKEIELLQGNMINEKAKALKLTEAEYSRFIKLLGSDKKTIMEAVALVLGMNAQELEKSRKGDDIDAENRDDGGESGRIAGGEYGISREQEGKENMG